MPRLPLLLLAIASTVWAQVPGPDPRWQTKGAGVAANRPAQCAANRDVYICIGAGCTNGFETDYCTTSNTWTAVGNGSVAAGVASFNGQTGTVTGVSSINGLTGTPTGFVQDVNTKPGPHVLLGASDVGLSNVPNINATNMNNAAAGILLQTFIDPLIARRIWSNTFGSTTLQQVTASSAPTFIITGGAAGSYTYKVVAALADGTHAAVSAGATTAVGPTTLDSTHTIQVNLTANATAQLCDVYRTAGGPTQGKIAASVACGGSVIDNGLTGDSTVPPAFNNSGGFVPVKLTVAQLLTITSAPTSTVLEVGDGASTSDCATGSGSSLAWCQWNGTSWNAIGGGAGGSPAFSGVTSGTNTTASMVLGTGSTFSTSGTATVNFGATTGHIRPFRIDTTANITGSTCTQGEMAFGSDATPGSNLYGCSSTNTWTLQAGGGGGTPGGANTQIQINNTGSFGASAAFTFNTATKSFTVNPTSASGGAGGQSTNQAWTSDPTGMAATMVEPWCTNPSSGNFQAGACSDRYFGGLFNPANYGNIAGSYDRQTIFNGRNAADNSDKKTMSGKFFYTNFPGSGQRAGINNNVNCYGVGDCFAASHVVTYGSYTTASGDEGASGPSSYVFQDSTLVSATTTAPIISSCAVTALAAGVAKSTNPTDIKTVNVTGSTGSCSIGDWLTIDQGVFESTDSNVENVQLTAVGPSSISALFQAAHINGAPVAPAKILTTSGGFGGSQERWGQGRIVVDDTAAAVTAGTILSVASQTVTGSGTSWSAGMVGGNANLPGCIAFTADNFTSSPFSGGAPLVSWFPIQSVTDGTHLVISRPYSGVAPTGSAAYTIRPCGRIGNLIMSYGTNAETVTGVALEANSFPWTTGHVAEQMISPYSRVQHLFLANWTWYGPIGTAPDLVTAYNNGFAQANSGYRIPANFLDSTSHASFKVGVKLDAETASGAIVMGGGDLSGIGIQMNAVGADRHIIYWVDGSNTSQLYPLQSGNGFAIDQFSSKIRFGTVGNSSINSTFDYSGVTSPRTLTIPDASGTLALSFPGSITRTLPAAANDEVDIGTFSIATNDGSFDVTIDDGAYNTTKRYVFTVAYTGASTWFKVYPISATVGAGDFDLDVESVNTSGLIGLRVRKVSGAGTSTMGITIAALPTGTFTSSTATSTVTPPASFWPTAVIQQISSLAQVQGTLQLIGTATDPGCTTSAHVGRFWMDITDANNTARKTCLMIGGAATWVVF